MADIMSWADELLRSPWRRTRLTGGGRSPHHDSRSSGDVLGWGFAAGLRGIAPGDVVQERVAAATFVRATLPAKLLADVSRADSALTYHRSRETQATALVSRCQAMPIPSPLPKPADGASLPITGLRTVLGLGTASVCGVAEAVITRITLGPVFGFPTHGPAQWDGWVFASAVALLVVAMEVSVMAYVVRPLRSPDSKGAPSALRWLLVFSIVAVAAIGLAGALRWVYLRHDAQQQLADAAATIRPLFDAYPILTLVALVALTVAFALEGTLGLGLGFHALEAFTGRASAHVARLAGRVWCTVCVACARAILRHRQWTVARADARRIGAAARQEAESTSFDAFAHYVKTATEIGATLGAQARETDPSGHRTAWVLRAQRDCVRALSDDPERAGFNAKRLYGAAPLPVHQRVREALAEPLRSL